MRNRSVSHHFHASIGGCSHRKRSARQIDGWLQAGRRIAPSGAYPLENEAPDDDRPRDAIARARAYGAGELSTADEIRRRFVAGRAAKSVTTPAAIASSLRRPSIRCRAYGAHAFGAAAYAVKAVAADRPAERESEVACRWST